MTPEERFEHLEASHTAAMERMDRWEVEFEKAKHEFELRFQRLTEMQTVLMESQNDTWKAIDRLTQNVEKLVRGRGPNGQED